MSKSSPAFNIIKKHRRHQKKLVKNIKMHPKKKKKKSWNMLQTLNKIFWKIKNKD